MSKCPKSPNGIHTIRRGPFTPDTGKSEPENQEAFEKWKKDFKVSDQFCIHCGEAIW